MRRWFLRIILIGIFWLTLFDINAQQFLRFEHLSRIDGLSQSSVNCMIRDETGFMWFGTQDGLNRYDGKKFRVLQNQPGDSSSISNNYIVSLCEDEKGAIWAGTMTGGLCRFDRQRETFRVFQHSENRNSISENTVWTVLSDGDGNIWAGTSKGLNRYAMATGSFSCYRHIKDDPGSITTDMVVSLYRSKQGQIWVGTVEGLCQLNITSGKFVRYDNPEKSDVPGANLIWSISETPDGDIITGTNNGVYLLDHRTKQFIKILGERKKGTIVAWSVEARQPGIIWAGTDKGLFSINTHSLQTFRYCHDPSDPQSIVDNNIWCLLPDPAGFLWAGTNNGIAKSKNTKPLFHLINGDASQHLFLSSSKVTAVLEDRTGHLWVGTDGGGLNCISPDRRSNTIYRSSNSGLQNNNVWALDEDREGNIWIGNYQGGLHVLKRKTGKILSFPCKPNDPYALSNNRILSLLTDPDGKIWIGTRGGGLNRFDPATGKFDVFLNSSSDPTSLSSNTVLSLAMDQQNRLWVGTFEGGLNMLLPGNTGFKKYKNIKGDLSSLSDNNVWAILFTREGGLWLGTGGGLNYSEKVKNTLNFRHFTTHDGLKSNTIFGLEEDNEGNIWMSNFSGLTKLDIRALESSAHTRGQSENFFPIHSLFRFFDSDHGLQGLEFSQGAYNKGIDGTIYFGGSNGLNYFTPGEVKESSFKPQVAITGLKIFNKEVSLLAEGKARNREVNRIIREGDNYFLAKSITDLNELVLSYRESVISFEFVSLDHSNPDKNQYAYKMVNFDKDWNYVGTQNNATYTNLDPGEYIFLVRGSNSDGTWPPLEKVLKVIIEPPFWKTAGFIVSSIILILLLGFLSVRKVFLNQRRKAQKEKEIIELQLKTIKSQIDPHFAFNAINTIASFIYSESPDTTYDYFTRFARMIRNILEDNEKISRLLSEEIAFVQNYLELQKMRFNEKFNYIIRYDENVLLDTPIPKMIIQTYAENAIKHGLMHRKEGGLLTIEIKQGGAQLIVKIEDNGVGRERALQLNPDTTRRGLRIIEQIFELYSKLYQTRIDQEIEDLIDENGIPSGTRVILTVFYLNNRKRRTGRFNLSLKKKNDGE